MKSTDFRGVVERFWEKVDKQGPEIISSSRCWVWKGARNRKGYGTCYPRGRAFPEGAHRFSWQLAHDMEPIPPSLHVLHRCDNPSCVRPDHLFTGTREDNMQDAVSKGRHVSNTKINPAIAVRGERHWSYIHPERVTRGNQKPWSLLDETKVIEARARYARGGVSVQKLADEYGVSRTAMGLALRRRTWKHVP